MFQNAKDYPEDASHPPTFSAIRALLLQNTMTNETLKMEWTTRNKKNNLNIM